MIKPSQGPCLGIVGFLLLFSSSTYAQTYRVLLTNDDGIESPLLAALKVELQALPGVEVTVSAPHENQSGSSMSYAGGELIVERIYRDETLFGYAVHGKPADAVRFGLTMLSNGNDFDLVVSGINRGANVGDVSHSSGTVGAAMAAQFYGVPSIAVSQDVRDVDTVASARFAARLVQKYQREGAPRGVVISINIPGGELKGVQVRPMGDSYLGTAGYELLSQSGNSSTYEHQRIIVQSTDSTTDTYSYQNGFVTITPLKFDWTDYDFISEVESWNLQLN
jgi:5'-nucleotidase